jgi:hypothetical protein
VISAKEGGEKKRTMRKKRSGIDSYLRDDKKIVNRS